LAMLQGAKLAYLEALTGATKVELLVRMDSRLRRIGVSLTGAISENGVLEHEFLVPLAQYTEHWATVPEVLRPLFQGPTHQQRVAALALLPSTPLLVSFEVPRPEAGLTYAEVR